MHHLASDYIGCHFVRKGNNPDGNKQRTAFLRFRHAGAALAVIHVWNGLYIPSIGPKPLGLEMSQDNLLGGRAKSKGAPPAVPPTKPSPLASSVPVPPKFAAPIIAAPAAPIIAAPVAPIIAAPKAPIIAVPAAPIIAVPAAPIKAAAPRPSQAASLPPWQRIPAGKTSTIPTARPSKLAAPYTALDPATKERYAGTLAGYISPKSKGLLPQFFLFFFKFKFEW
jgi:hypothetical protein